MKSAASTSSDSVRLDPINCRLVLLIANKWASEDKGIDYCYYYCRPKTIKQVFPASSVRKIFSTGASACTRAGPRTSVALARASDAGASYKWVEERMWQKTYRVSLPDRQESPDQSEVVPPNSYNADFGHHPNLAVSGTRISGHPVAEIYFTKMWDCCECTLFTLGGGWGIFFFHI